MGSLPTDDVVDETAQAPWINTPCIYSAALSQTAGCNIYLKLENLQPSGSFKSRGIGNLMVRALAKAKSSSGSSTPNVHFFCSSGGNAGLACATAARDLGRYPVTIAVPTTTSPYMVGRLRGLGAIVHQAGADWAAADQFLRTLMAEAAAAPGSDADSDSAGPVHAVYVPPFDHPDIWAGAATLVGEVHGQLQAQPRAPVPDAFVCSVGGGGLLVGLVDGIDAVYGGGGGGGGGAAVPGAPPLPQILAVETAGAESLSASLAAGRVVTLPGGITSIATSLGVPRVLEQAFAYTHRATTAASDKKTPRATADIASVVVSDAAAVDAIVRFLDDTRLLVEPACGAALAPVYTAVAAGGPDTAKTPNLLRQQLGAGLSDGEWAARNVVLVVCGGSNISLEMLAAFRARFGV